LVKSTELSTKEPLTIDPPANMELMVMPCWPFLSCTNLAGGDMFWLVQMGQLSS